MALPESGAGGFVRLVEDGDYVDKSMLIADILGMNDRGVYLFTRPMGFGKSVNISMLDAFFNIGYEGNTWFDGLEISEHHEFDGYRNRFPVIHLDLKDVVPTPKESDYAGFLKMIRLAIQESCEPFRHLLNSDSLYADEERTLSSILDGTVDGVLIPQTLRRVCRIIERVHGRKVVVLIDGYDRAVTNSFGTDLQADIICFLGALMSAILKSNSALQMGYVTGVMQVAKAGMFSGLNNLDVNNVFSRDSDERFGFTEGEVRGILEYYGHPEKMSEVKDWYDGYRFGDAEVYNPYCVMRYVRNGFLPEAYWSLSGNDAPIRWMLDRTNRESFDAVANIVGGTSVETDIHPDMTYDDLRRSRGTDLFSLMVMTGYLKAVPSEDGFKVSVPNTEVMGMVNRVLNDIVPVDDRLYTDLALAVRDGNVAGMEDCLETLMDGSSYFDLRDESDYKLVLFAGIRGIIWRYDVECERQRGNGRLDMIFTPKDDSVPPIVMELKVADSEDRLESEALEGIRQIHAKHYHHRMSGEVLLYGISFWGVIPKVVLERLHL